jgi:hypothetical protein
MEDQLVKLEGDVNKALEDWKDILIEKWQWNLFMKKIWHTGSGYDSFKGTVNGAINAVVTFFFNYYLKFVDMGVGKGVKITDVKENSISRQLLGRKYKGDHRRPKKWYSKELAYNTHKLGPILQKVYGKAAVGMTVESLQSLNDPK